MAKPTNRVLEMVLASSGCCAMERSAWDTALPSPMAGAMEPTAMVRPAITMDTIPIKLAESMLCLLCHGSRVAVLFLAFRRRRRDVDDGQYGENIRLDDARQQSQQLNHDGEQNGNDAEQDGDDHRGAHHIPVQTHRKRKGARHLADDVKGQHH